MSGFAYTYIPSMCVCVVINLMVLYVDILGIFYHYHANILVLWRQKTEKKKKEYNAHFLDYDSRPARDNEVTTSRISKMKRTVDDK